MKRHLRTNSTEMSEKAKCRFELFRILGIKQDVGALKVKKSSGFLNSDFQMDLAGFWVNGGNFRIKQVNTEVRSEAL